MVECRLNWDTPNTGTGCGVRLPWQQLDND